MGYRFDVTDFTLEATPESPQRRIVRTCPQRYSMRLRIYLYSSIVNCSNGRRVPPAERGLELISLRSD